MGAVNSYLVDSIDAFTLKLTKMLIKLE